jgi:hypothetical protein
LGRIDTAHQAAFRATFRSERNEEALADIRLTFHALDDIWRIDAAALKSRIYDFSRDANRL